MFTVFFIDPKNFSKKENKHREESQCFYYCLEPLKHFLY